MMHLFNSWDRLIETALSSVLFFVIIVVLVRVAGKRTTANMNNFDWIVTVAIGSVASSGILLKNVSLADATIAIVVLAASQWLITWAVVRSEWVAQIIKPSPRLLIHKGGYLTDAMKKERITREEIKARLRGAGYTSLDDANWVIIETNGDLTVIPRQDEDIGGAEMLEGVAHDNLRDYTKGG